MIKTVVVHEAVASSEKCLYFSIIQRKVLTPNDFPDLEAVRVRLALYEELTNKKPKPFAWKFTREDLMKWLKRSQPHFAAQTAK